MTWTLGILYTEVVSLEPVQSGSKVQVQTVLMEGIHYSCEYCNCFIHG